MEPSLHQAEQPQKPVQRRRERKEEQEQTTVQGQHPPGVPVVPPKPATDLALYAVRAREGRRRGTGLKLSMGKGDERCFPQCLFNCLPSCFS